MVAEQIAVEFRAKEDNPQTRLRSVTQESNIEHIDSPNGFVLNTITEFICMVNNTSRITSLYMLRMRDDGE